MNTLIDYGYELIKQEDNIVGKCYNISKMYEVGFGGNINALYDIKLCPCTWWIEGIVERDEDSPSIPKKVFKGECFGLTVWDILQEFTAYMYYIDLQVYNWKNYNKKLSYTICK